MIKVNDEFEYYRYHYGWAVNRYTKSTNKDGQPTVKKRTTYHPHLIGVCNFIIDYSVSDAKHCKEVIQCINKAKEELLEAIERQKQEEILGDLL